MITKTITKATTLIAFIGLIVGMTTMAGCESQNTYSKLRKKEKKLISDYIEREGIKLVGSLSQARGDKNYYAVPDYDDFYINIISIDSASDAKAKAGDVILARYIKYSLDSYPDTIRYWNTDDGGEPISFQLGNTSDSYYCAGWTVAMSLLEYSGSRCRIICPSKLGFTADNSSVTPYGYELKLTIKP